jgi:hypothetical protein
MFPLILLQALLIKTGTTFRANINCDHFLEPFLQSRHQTLGENLNKWAISWQEFIFFLCTEQYYELYTHLGVPNTNI